MALWHCTGCTAAYAVGLAACPQCGATDHTETEDETVPKINRQGPSYEPGKEPYGAVPPPVDAEPEPAEQPEPEKPAEAPAAPAAAPADDAPPPPPPPAA